MIDCFAFIFQLHNFKLYGNWSCTSYISRPGAFTNQGAYWAPILDPEVYVGLMVRSGPVLDWNLPLFQFYSLFQAFLWVNEACVFDFQKSKSGAVKLIQYATATK